MMLYNFLMIYSSLMMILASTLNNSSYVFLILIKLIYFMGLFNMMTNLRNFLITMLWIEVMYVSMFLDFMAASIFMNAPLGQVYALVLLIAIAGESCIGLGLLLNLQKRNKTLIINKWTHLRGKMHF